MASEIAQSNSLKTNVLYKFRNWVTEHPTAYKVVLAVALVFGALAAASLPFSLPILGAIAIGLCAFGGLVALISIIGLSCVKKTVIQGKNIEPNFQPAEYEGGRLYFQGKMPVLELPIDTPFKAGEIHGYLLGEQIGRITWFLAKKERDGNSITDHIRAVVDQRYIDEMHGIVEGHNKWANENNKPRINFGQLAMLHIIPETALLKEQKRGRVGCTTLALPDKTGHYVLGRNLDWSSFGLLGSHTLLIVRKSERSQTTINIGFPGFVGTVTGINEAGLALAMNTSRNLNSQFSRRMPATFLNRYCLDHCRSIGEVERVPLGPMGPYHLIVATKTESLVRHFFQGNPHNIRAGKAERNEVLLTVNAFYDQEPPRDMDSQDNGLRERNIHKLIQEPRQDDTVALVTQSMQLPKVNDQGTIQSCVFDLQSGLLYLAHANQYAASQSYETIDLRALFGRVSARVA